MKKEKTVNLKLIISYDGSNYAGWQRLGKESNGKTIQGVLESMLERVFPNGSINGKKYEVIGSGRTDAGVHAKAQVANVHMLADVLDRKVWRLQKETTKFQKSTRLERIENLEMIRNRMNNILPDDIKIRSVEIVNKKFHSRYSAVSKIYEYQIDTREKANVFTRKYALSCPKALDLGWMREGAQYFIGTHDFEAFSSKMKDGRSTICTIEWIKIEKENDMIWIQIKGDGFLYHMVRIMVGTLLLVGMKEKKPEDIQIILESKERSLAGPIVSSQGLYLREVFYDYFYRAKEK